MYGNQHGHPTSVHPELTADDVDFSVFRDTLVDIRDIVSNALPHTINTQLAERNQTVVGALSIVPKAHPNQAVTVIITPQMADTPYIETDDRKEIATDIIARFVSQSLAAHPQETAAMAE